MSSIHHHMHSITFKIWWGYTICLNLQLFSNWQRQGEKSNDCYCWWRSWWKPEIWKIYKLFKRIIPLHLDAFSLARNALDRSTFNRAEPRWLNLANNWVVLSSNTINLGVILMRRRWRLTTVLSWKAWIEYTGCLPAEIWSGLVIYENPVIAEFIKDDGLAVVWPKSEKWKACHVWQWQYFLQTVKFTDPICCSSFQPFNHHTW